MDIKSKHTDYVIVIEGQAIKASDLGLKDTPQPAHAVASKGPAQYQLVQATT